MAKKHELRTQQKNDRRQMKQLSDFLSSYSARNGVAQLLSKNLSLSYARIAHVTVVNWGIINACLSLTPPTGNNTQTRLSSLALAGGTNTRAAFRRYRSLFLVRLRAASAGLHTPANKSSHSSSS